MALPKETLAVAKTGKRMATPIKRIAVALKPRRICFFIEMSPPSGYHGSL